MRLNVKAVALAFALVWGFGLFIITWWIILTSGATGEPTFIGRIYLGYKISPLGSVIGLVWALLDGFVAGAIFTWLYNLIAAKGTKET